MQHKYVRQASNSQIKELKRIMIWDSASATKQKRQLVGQTSQD
jgi:hypothetical protein